MQQACSLLSAAKTSQHPLLYKANTMTDPAPHASVQLLLGSFVCGAAVGICEASKASKHNIKQGFVTLTVSKDHWALCECTHRLRLPHFCRQCCKVYLLVHGLQGSTAHHTQDTCVYTLGFVKLWVLMSASMVKAWSCSS